MVAERALVEKLGLVLPSRNGPHSGWPLPPQPAGSWASLRMSAYPIGVFGQPSDSAMGRGMAMTSGVRMNGRDAGAWAGCPATDRRWLSMAPQALDAGDQITGLVP